MAESPNRRKNLFFKALDLAPAERSAFLVKECGGDEPLRREIEALLQAHGKPDSFLERPAAALGATVDAGTAPPQGQVLPDAFLGTHVGPYKLREQIGEGGMGVVYVAEQQEPVRRRVALKVIKPGMDSAQVLARFEAERQALAMMDHPNIAKVLDAGTTAEGRPYFVMELVKGVPITQYCDERRLSLEQRLKLFIPVCQAVQHAHQKAIIHRDLKPSNVLIALYDGKPVPKVIDFGVAKAMGEQLTDKSIYTGFGAVVGTLAYMSPEQAELNQIDIDTRSDIYSLGVMLYELLTGSTPIDRQRLKEGAILEVLRLIREEEPPRPSTRISTANTLVTLSQQRQTEPAKLASLIRGDIDWIVMKALDKDRGRRYETANSLAADIERFLKDEPVEASPPSAGYRVRKFVRRNRGAVTAAGVVLVALLIGIAGTSLGMLEARRARDAAELARLDEQKERVRAEKAEKTIGEQLTEVLETKGQLTTALAKAEKSASDEKAARDQVEQERGRTQKELGRAESLLYVSQFKEAVHHYEKGDFVNCRLALDECRWDMRGPEYGYLVKQMEGRGRLLLGKRCNGRLVMSKDGKRLFTGNSQEPGVAEWDGETGAFVRSLRCEGFCRCMAVSSDGKLLFAGFGASIVAWNLDTGAKVFTMGWGSLGNSFTSLAVSGDGKRLFAGSSYSLKAVSVWDLEEHKEVMAFEGSNTIERLTPSPDGKRLFASTTNRFKVWDLTTGKEAFKLPDPTMGTGSGMSVILSNDGKTLFSHDSSDIVLRNAETGKEIRRWREGSMPIDGLALSKDGKNLACAVGDSIVVWDVATGKSKHTMRGHPALVTGLEFSPDGTRLFSACGMDQSLRMWDLQVTHEAFAYLGHNKAVEALAQDASGKRLVSASYDETIKVWDTVTGKTILTLPGKGYELHLALSGDGKRLYSGAYEGKSIKAWDLELGKEIFSLNGHTAGIQGLALSPDGKTLYSGSFDKTIKAWDLQSRKEIYTYRGNTSPVENLVISNDGKRICSLSNGGVLKVVDAESGTEIFSYNTLPAMRKLALTSDGKRLVYGGGFDTIHVLDVESGREIHTLKGHFGGNGIVLSKDDKRIFSAGTDGTVRIWDMISGRELLVVTERPQGIASLAVSRDGKRLLCGRGNGAIVAWDLVPGDEPRTVSAGVYTKAYRLAVSHDGKRLVTAGSDRVIRTWNDDTGKEVLALSAHRNLISAMAVSGDGRWLVTADLEKLIRRWDLTTGKEVQVLTGHARNDHGVHAVLLSPDGKRLFSADTTIKEWDLAAGKPIRTLPGHFGGTVVHFALGHDGYRLVSVAADHTVKVWDLRTYKETLAFSCLGTPAISKDGTRLAGLDRDQSIKVWNLDTGKVIATLPGQGDRMAMSSDGKRLYAGDRDGGITVYDLESAKAIRTLRGHTQEVLHLALRADGRRLYSIGYDGMKVWNLDESK